MKNGDDAGPRVPDASGGEPPIGDERADFDEELGRRMARDARRVSNGELAEAEFHERYHEAVLEEFGRDDRPIETGGNS